MSSVLYVIDKQSKVAWGSEIENEVFSTGLPRTESCVYKRLRGWSGIEEVIVEIRLS